MDSPQAQQQHFAQIRFCVPDASVGPEERSLFGFPANKEVVHERVELHDFRTSSDIVKGPAGLDVQGFTYINHRSALSNADQWFTGKHVEEVYIPEVEDLICRATGAKKAVANNISFRRKLAEQHEDPAFYHKRGHPIEQAILKYPKDSAMVFGKVQSEALEPARMAHIDYSVKGLRDSARYCRTDIAAAAKSALDAEDVKATEVPRYAAYSVWRPVKTVKRDPLAVCDWRTVDKENGLAEMSYRATSNITENEEYIMEAWAVTPPRNLSSRNGIGCRSRGTTRCSLSNLPTPPRTRIRISLAGVRMPVLL